MTYPNVLDEVATLRRIVAGASIARYGDGEFKICRGGRCKSQEGNPALTRRLCAILRDPGPCLVGIPNIRSKTPKAAFWGPYLTEAPPLLNPKASYVSSFISRPDSAPWIDRPEYWDLVISLWRARDVCLVRGSGKSLTTDDLPEAKTVTEIHAPRQHAWSEYDSLVRRVRATGLSRVLICLGPTATVMATDLCAVGLQGIDLGHIALFLRKHRRGEALQLTADDKAAV